MIVTPMKNNILVAPIARESVNGGIHLPEQSSDLDSRKARVVICGPACVEGLKPGDVVLVQAYGQNSVIINGSKMFLIDEDSLMAVLERD